MATYLLLYVTSTGTDVYPFQSPGNVPLVTIEGTDLSDDWETDSFEDLEPFLPNISKQQWSRIKQILSHFKLNFKPGNNESITFEEVSSDIRWIP